MSGCARSPHTDLLLGDSLHALLQIVTLERGPDLADQPLLTVLHPEADVPQLGDEQVAGRLLLFLCFGGEMKTVNVSFASESPMSETSQSSFHSLCNQASGSWWEWG